MEIPFLTIRSLNENDAASISRAFHIQGWHKPAAQYQKYYSEQQSGLRTVLLAECKGNFAGYVTIVWTSGYLPFQRRHIPEIVDFNVLKKYQRKGIGTALMDEAEQRIKQISAIAGIGVGLIRDYGAAQILYIKRGYVPDGRGAILDNEQMNFGDEVVMGDVPVLYFTKQL